ncbi:unnamed protein product [Cylindrotheca closterium]|uniref:GDT1 family protein n=1 Tax=Cylindrotheca closterium TaxID=2856 RepID=A0AAD2FI59_9STRA|nr:unnamed protein product [Cylindrotheca closterium]
MIRNAFILLACAPLTSAFSSISQHASIRNHQSTISFAKPPSVHEEKLDLLQINEESSPIVVVQDVPKAIRGGVNTAAMVAVSAAALTAAVAFSQVSNAVDITSITGGATSLATNANSFLGSFGETGFYQAFSLVFLSEIGDKTFFIAGLLAARFSKTVAFVGSIGALAVMTVISVLIGQIFHVVPSGIADGIPLDDVAAVLAFAFFGFKTLKEALAMEEGTSIMDEELEEAEEEVEGFVGSDGKGGKTAFARVLSIFGLVFAAEFGDRSFLSTIALSAAQNPVGVAVGGIAAHAVATGIAVSGGAVVAKYLSERVIGIIGGSLFIVFAVTTALGIF